MSRPRTAPTLSRALRWRPWNLRLAVLPIVAMLAGTVAADDRIADIRQGTNMTLAVSPDGETMIVSLLGRLWLLPVSGGGAMPLTPADEHARHPRISPDGRQVVYQRMVDDRWSLMLTDLTDRSRRVLTDGIYNDREPDFTTDGSAIVFASDRGGQYGLWRIIPDAGNVVSRLTAEAGDASFPTVSERGETAYVLERGGRWLLKALTPAGATVQLHESSQRLSAPSWRPGGSVIIFNEHGPHATVSRMLVLSDPPLLRPLNQDEDVFVTRAAWLSPAEYLYAADGRIWRRGLAQVGRSPVHLNAAVPVPTHEPPRIRIALDAPGPHRAHGHTGITASADGRISVAAALGDLWLRVGDDPPVQLTDDRHLQAQPALSPDGRELVYASDRSGSMNLWLMDIASGSSRPLTSGQDKHFAPAFSPDGLRIVFLGSEGLGPWAPSNLQVLNLTDEAGLPRTIASGLSDADTPRWSEAGDRIAVTAALAPALQRSQLWFDAVDGSLTLPGSLATTPTHSDDVEAAMGSIQWMHPAADEPYVVQVGRLFDGLGSDYLRHMDIHVSAQRITAIVGRNVLPLPEHVIDASDMTMLPGLIDLHAHQSVLSGERLGRMWLAWGVTTVRELTTRMDEALERSEAWASGRRTGPRLIVSPSATVAEAATNRVTGNNTTPYPVVVQHYPGIADGLGHSLMVQAHTLRIAPWTGLHQLPTALQRWGGQPRDRIPFEISPLSYSYQDVLDTTIASGTVVTTTLGALGGIDSLGETWRNAMADPAFLALFLPSEHALWNGNSGAAVPLQGLKEKIARLVRGGGRVSAGTDAPAVPYGLGVHAELTLLNMAGIPNDQVLRIATAQAAMALGLEDQIGTLEAGKLADFIIVDGDPLHRIEDTRRITAVVTGGRWLNRETLWR